MKFVFGKIPDNSDFNPCTEGWVAIKEPTLWLSQLIALPIGLLIAILLGVLWYSATPLNKFGEEIKGSVLLWIIGIVICHELIHALFHPKCGVSSDTFLGFWPSKFLFYAHYDSILSKRRFMTILITPFVFLSLLPLMLCAVFQYAPAEMFSLSIFNTMLASVDVFGFFLVFWSVPQGVLVRNKGWKTYYRMPEQSAGVDG